MVPKPQDYPFTWTKTRGWSRVVFSTSICVLYAGERVVMRPNLKHIGFGKPKKGWEFGGGGNKGAMGDKGD
jgi:hypothetical protein